MSDKRFYVTSRPRVTKSQPLEQEVEEMRDSDLLFCVTETVKNVLGDLASGCAERSYYVYDHEGSCVDSVNIHTLHAIAAKYDLRMRSLLHAA